MASRLDSASLVVCKGRETGWPQKRNKQERCDGSWGEDVTADGLQVRLCQRGGVVWISVDGKKQIFHRNKTNRKGVAVVGGELRQTDRRPAGWTLPAWWYLHDNRMRKCKRFKAINMQEKCKGWLALVGRCGSAASLQVCMLQAVGVVVGRRSPTKCSHIVPTRHQLLMHAAT
jgi:hypothetical protein